MVLVEGKCLHIVGSKRCLVTSPLWSRRRGGVFDPLAKSECGAFFGGPRVLEVLVQVGDHRHTLGKGEEEGEEDGEEEEEEEGEEDGEEEGEEEGEETGGV